MMKAVNHTGLLTYKKKEKTRANTLIITDRQKNLRIDINRVGTESRLLQCINTQPVQTGRYADMATGGRLSQWI